MTGRANVGANTFHSVPGVRDAVESLRIARANVLQALSARPCYASDRLRNVRGMAETENPDIEWVSRIEDDMFRDGTDLPFKGWNPIINRLHRELVALDPDYRLTQVKEKLGTLRVYGLYAPAVRERCEAAVNAATRESARTCEFCAEPGTLRADQARHLTLCEFCNAARNAYYATHPG